MWRVMKNKLWTNTVNLITQKSCDKPWLANQALGKHFEIPDKKANPKATYDKTVKYTAHKDH